MRMYFKGAYRSDEKLPHEELKRHPDAVKFKEFENTTKFLIVINLLSFLILILTAYLYNKYTGLVNISITGVFLVFISMIPHEFIHSLYFKRRTYLYVHQLALMITGTEVMTKKRYIAMCVTPSLFFGVMPFLLYLINHDLTIFGTFGGISLAMCLGDFYNAYHCYTQVPKNGMCFMSKQNTYWYIPKNPIRLKRVRPTVVDKLFQWVSIALVLFIFGVGIYNIECIGLCLQILLYELTVYAIIAYLQLRYGGIV